MKTLKTYHEALKRLKTNKPIRIKGNYKINKDTVALEAGMKRGTIKKSRPIFEQLIIDIENAENERTAKTTKYIDQIEKYKAKAKKFESLYNEAINRELMLYLRLEELEKSKNDKHYTDIPVNNIQRG